jgi:hypothetical protein
MKRLFVLLAALTALAAVLAGSALAGGNAAPKATGDITFLNTAYEAQGIPATQGHWVFTAQQAQGSAAKGNMSYTDGYGSYTANVTALQVSGHDATITAQVTTSTTPYAYVGLVSTWTVHDMGEPGVGHDYFSVPNFPVQGGSFDEPTISAGNIQVQS